jgi:hypothetical protein
MALGPLKSYFLRKKVGSQTGIFLTSDPDLDPKLIESRIRIRKKSFGSTTLLNINISPARQWELDLGVMSLGEQGPAALASSNSLTPESSYFLLFLFHTDQAEEY